MPPYKEFTIRIREAGFKFIVIAVTVEHIPESQLIRSLRARLTRHDLGTFQFEYSFNMQILFSSTHDSIFDNKISHRCGTFSFITIIYHTAIRNHTVLHY